MNPRFGGIARLYGEKALRRFHQAHVAVVGIGGVGSWAVEALARSGIGKLTLVDLDEICETNINRQLHAMDGQIGRQKTEAMAERVRAIHPEAQVEIVYSFFKESTALDILKGDFDALIDAIDTRAHKALLLAECRQRGIHVVTCGAAGGRRDPTRIRVEDLAYSGKDAMLQQLRRTLRRDHGFAKAPEGGKPESMGIEAVFSEEAPWYVQCDGEVSRERPEDAGSKGGPVLGCDWGLGSATHVTASFGQIAAGRVLEFLAAGAKA
ncbi:MAG: tRNA threonylcarbamoyladenosine dehydratase [Akkermansiaceae bacterium]|nr:tRNA threonylcarbamoyladenosine dehydratase [Akkermansiaceae bacterium]